MILQQDAKHRIEALLAHHPRVLLGLAGAPGAGKSTLATLIARHWPQDTAIVPMDGFHLAQVELDRLNRSARKGAPDTFDAAGFTALLARIRANGPETIYAPCFAREIEEPIANAIPVSPHHRLIVVEGNYLLFDNAWSGVRGLLHETWFVDAEEQTRDAWLLARHIRFGRTPEAACAWIEQTDAPNARAINATARRADWKFVWSIA